MPRRYAVSIDMLVESVVVVAGISCDLYINHALLDPVVDHDRPSNASLSAVLRSVSIDLMRESQLPFPRS
jgi:hypothetical protein